MVRPHRTSSNHCDAGGSRPIGQFRVSLGRFDHTEPPRTTVMQGEAGLPEPVHIVTKFGVVQAHRTEPHHRRDSKVCRVLSHEFGVVRLCRTFSNLIFTGEARCAGCLCTSSGWFKYIEPPRTFSNHIIAEITRCVEFFHMSSEWFDSTEPFLTTSS